MKNTVKIAFCGMLCALGTALMLLAYFPYFTYAVPAVAGFLTVIVFIEIGPKWAVGTYIITAVLTMLFAEPEAKLMYVLFFGYYPLIKIYIEKIRLRVIGYILKLLVFNAAISTVYGIFAKLFYIDFHLDNPYGIFGIIAMLLLSNITFLLYDVVIIRITGQYLSRFHLKIQKFFK